MQFKVRLHLEKDREIKKERIKITYEGLLEVVYRVF